MNGRNHPPERPDLAWLKAKAKNLRRHMVAMAAGRGQGYLGQGLGMADILAALYFHEMRTDRAEPHWLERDRFVLSTGHYSIALWAALAELGVIPLAELSTYGADRSRLDMSTIDSTPGVEVIGGSLGHGLGQAVGMALGIRLDGLGARIFCELSDGELQEGSTWEAAIAAASFKLDNLVAVVDCNGIQADGRIVVDIEPIAEKWRAFGWAVQEIDGNDMARIVEALERARDSDGRPKAIVARTLPGKGVPMLERREKAHFLNIGPDEAEAVKRELEASSD